MNRRRDSRDHGRRARAFTLVEVLMAMTITSLVSIVLGGLIMAVHTAREHTEGLENVTLEAQAAIERIKYAVGNAGIYRVSGQPLTPGLVVIKRSSSWYELPDILVVWNGGRDGRMADEGLQTRLPRMNELTIYTYDSDAPNRLLEITLPASTTEVDLRDPMLLLVIKQAIADPQAEKVVLCTRIRTSPVSASLLWPSTTTANVRFELTHSPSDAQLSSTSPGTAAWNTLPWAGGIVGSDFGMRTATLRVELQLEAAVGGPQQNAAGKSPVIPFFGSASYRYVYRP